MRTTSDLGFYIGDICYVLADNIYSLIWGDIYDYSMPKDGFIVPKGTMVNNLPLERDFVVCVESTAYGDGEYYDNNGHIYPVDAGVIGVVPLELCCKQQNGLHLGRVIEVLGEATLECPTRGNFVICVGNTIVTINTDEYGNEDEEYDYDEEVEDYEDDDNMY